MTTRELVEDLKRVNDAAAREMWLKERRRGVGASEVAAILGVDPRRNQLELYAEKVDALVREDTPWMRWGLKAEALVGEAYGEETGRMVLDPPGGRYHIARSQELDFLGATLDRITTPSDSCPAPVTVMSPRDAYVPLECKVVAAWNAERWREEAPVEYQVQLQIQMLCTGATWGSLAALVGWPPRPTWVDMERNDRFIAAALPRIEEFWQRVVDRDPPDPAPPNAASSAALRALWPADTGEEIALPEETVELVNRWEAAKARRGAFEDEAEDLCNQLRARMRDATVGILADGSVLTLKTTTRKAFTKTCEECTYRTLRHVHFKKARR